MAARCDASGPASGPAQSVGQLPLRGRWHCLRSPLAGAALIDHVAVLIPAYNAAKTLPPVLRAAKQQASTVVVVDDGSVDGTRTVAESGGATVIRHEKNQGKGQALKTGFAWAAGQAFDGIITLDADGQHLPGEIPKFVAAREQSGADLIIGGRSHLFEQMLARRRMANRFSAWTISKAAGVEVSDSQSGYRFYSTHLLRTIQTKSSGFDMESEIIVRAGRAGMRILTIPIDLGFVDGLSTSHYKPFKDTLRIAWTVARTRFFG